MKAVRFAETKPLPSYLIALAVGPFDVVEGGRAGRNRVPVRIITPAGTGAEAAYSARITAELLTRLEDYFGIPYPYQKLDNVAVPMVYGFGAMENAGLITYAQNIILARPEDESAEFRREYTVVAAHEIAHQWFGDLVTMAWWDDTWLNEAFATWMEQKIVAAWKPDWELPLSGVTSAQRAMQDDSLVSARRIRQPVNSPDDIVNAFDEITYEKGAAVIRMFESWTGEQAFQKGVQLYLKRHEFGNATYADFLGDVSAGSGRNIAPAFRTFLDQPGVPLLTVGLDCGPGAAGVAWSQRRFLPLGSPGSTRETWRIPACLRVGSAGNAVDRCDLLAGASGELPLQAAKCPDWLAANARQSGYYHVKYPGELLRALLSDGGRQLSPAERIGLLGDLSALTRGGEVPESEALHAALELSRDPNRRVVERTIDIIQGAESHLIPDALRSVYAEMIRDTYGARARDLGWNDKPGESQDARLSRPSIVGIVARQGQDAELSAEAGRLARRWLQDRTAISSDMVSVVLSVAAEHGGRELFDRFVAAAKSAPHARDRYRLLEALGSFRDPALARSSLMLLLSRDFDLRESMDILFGPLAYPETRALPFEFVRQHFDELVKLLPRGASFDAGAALPGVAGAFCGMDRYSEVEAFFKPRIAQFTGGPRRLAQVLESVRICDAVKKVQEPSAAEFLRAYRQPADAPNAGRGAN